MKKSLSVLVGSLLVLGMVFMLPMCSSGGDDKPCGDLECCEANNYACEGLKTCDKPTGKCIVDCGDDECCAAGDYECPGEDKCVDGTCMECCPGQDKHGWVQGIVISFPDNTPVAVHLTAYDGLQVATNAANAVKLDELDSGADGAYKTSCIDMTTVSKGLVLLADDIGAGENFYPTYSGVATTEKIEDKVCKPNPPPAFVLSNLIVGALAQATGIDDLATEGFALIFVVDANGNPVEGAQLKAANGGDLPENVTATYINFPANFPASPVEVDGTATSAQGLVLVQVTGTTRITNLMPVKEGLTWAAEIMGVIPEACFTRPFQAN